jgi:hypothetical protein
MTDAVQPADKEDLLAAIAREHMALEESLSAHPESRLTTPGAEGWSVKDHLSHLVAWHTIVIDELDGGSGAGPTGLSEEQFDSISEEELNDHLQKRDAQLGLESVRTAFDESLRELLDRVNAWSDEDLKRTLPWDGTRTYLSLVADNSSRHYNEHRPWIEDLARAAGP